MYLTYATKKGADKYAKEAYISMKMVKVCKNCNKPFEVLYCLAFSCLRKMNVIICNNVQAGNEAGVQMLMEVRGPGRCGLLLDILSPNLKRTRPELKTILKKYGYVIQKTQYGLISKEKENSFANIQTASVSSGQPGFS